MSIDKDTKEQVTSNSKDHETSESRRRFTKTGLAGSAVALSLFNRSALGIGNGAQCSMSILVSVAAGGSLDPRVDPHACQQIGCDPYTWHSTGIVGASHSWQDAGCPDPETLFSTIFGIDPSTLDPTIDANLTLHQALELSGTPLKDAISAGVAAYLNVCLADYLNSTPNLDASLQFSYGGGLQTNQVIDNFVFACNHLQSSSDGSLLTNFAEQCNSLSGSGYCPMAPIIN